MLRRPKPMSPGPGQESVWDYPRPAIAEPTPKTLEVVFAGEVIARTTRGFRALETSHPPTYYFPRADVRMEFLVRNSQRTACEWKGLCSWFDVVVGGETISSGAWSYENPTPSFLPIAEYVSFFARPMDRCTVNGEVVRPQEGQYYGGWITADVVGPFKGGPGSWGW